MWSCMYHVAASSSSKSATVLCGRQTAGCRIATREWEYVVREHHRSTSRGGLAAASRARRWRRTRCGGGEHSGACENELAPIESHAKAVQTHWPQMRLRSADPSFSVVSASIRQRVLMAGALGQFPFGRARYPQASPQYVTPPTGPRPARPPGGPREKLRRGACAAASASESLGFPRQRPRADLPAPDPINTPLPPSAPFHFTSPTIHENPASSFLSHTPSAIMTRTHKNNDVPHNHPEAEGAYAEHQIPKYFGKTGFADQAPNKVKKNGSGKGNW